MGLFGKLFGRTPAAMTSGRTLGFTDMRAIVGAFGNYGDSAYAEVNSSWLADFADDFRAECFRAGVTKWDPRFDCNHFAAFYVALAQLRFYAANFQSWTTAQTLAVGELWYRPQKKAGTHAVVIAIAESGVRYIEPQTGKFISLTGSEWASRLLVKF